MATAASEEQASDVERVLALMHDVEQAWSGVSDYIKVVEKTERLVNGTMTRQIVQIKFQRPNRYYLQVLEGPKKGSELIYPKNADEPVAVAHAGGFAGGFSRFLKKTVLLRRIVPTEFSLQDPNVIGGQHQTVVDASLGNTIHRIADNLRTAAELGEGQMRVEQECSDTDECMYRIDVELPATAGQFHEVKDGESLWTIAAQYDCPMYVIWYNNPKMKKPTDLRPGRTVFVPRYYASQGRIWISPKSKLLSKLEIFDSRGNLYERYVYASIQTNVGLTDVDFDTENPDYGF